MKANSIFGHKSKSSLVLVLIVCLFGNGTSEILSSSDTKSQQTETEEKFLNSTHSVEENTTNSSDDFYWQESFDNDTDTNKTDETYKELETKSEINPEGNQETKLSFNTIYWIIIGGVLCVFFTSLICSAGCGVLCAEPMPSSPEHTYKSPMQVVGLIGHYPTDPIMQMPMPGAPKPPPRRFPRHTHAGRSHERKSSNVLSQIQIETSIP